MNKKRLLIFLMCLIYTVSVAVGAAAEGITVQITDGVNGIVKVSGTAPGMQAGERVNILVLNEGVTLENAEKNISESVQYQGSVITDDGGEFSNEFRLFFSENAEEECNLSVYVGGDSFLADDTSAIPLYYASMGLKIGKADEFIKATEDKDDKLDKAKKIFAVDTEIFGKLDKEKLSSFFTAELEAAKLEFKANTDANIKANTEKYVTFEELLRYSIAMEAYNQTKTEYVLKGTKLEFDEMLGLSEYISKSGTLSEIYAKSITEDGVEKVLNGLFGTDSKSKEELQKTFAKLVIINGIKNNTSNGSGIVSSILTDANIKASGMDTPDYLALSSTELADDALYRMRDSLTLDNLCEKIEECAKIKDSAERPSEDDDNDDTSGSRGGSVSVSNKKDDVKEEKPEVTKPDTSDKAESFTDISSYGWAKEAIEYLAQTGVINGTGEGTFNPAGKLTREAAAKIICLALGVDVSEAKGSFTDVDNSSWYAPYVCTLSELGIVKGVSESAFGVGSNITREDFAVLIARAYSLSSDSEEISFTDSDSISDYARNSVSALASKGIITGYGDGSFAPKSNISRAEGAQIIYRVLNSYID